MLALITVRMETIRTNEKKLAAYRLSPVIIGRLRTKAKMQKISINQLVEDTLAESVKDVRSEEEIAAEKKAAKEFLTKCWGSWSGDETSEEIISSIRSARTKNSEVEL